MNQPTLGQMVSVPAILSDERKEGEVIYLLAMQFVIMDTNGNRWFCHYSHDWKTIGYDPYNSI